MSDDILTYIYCWQLFVSCSNASDFQFLWIKLTHWGRVTHISVSDLTIIGSDNGLSPGRHQAIIWTNAGILSIGQLGINFGEILFKIYTFSFKKIHLKVLSGKWRPSCFSLNVLKINEHCFWQWPCAQHKHAFTCNSEEYICIIRNHCVNVKHKGL